MYAAVTMALGNADLATEAVDEAFVRASPRWAKVGGYDNPAGWVYRVAVLQREETDTVPRDQDGSWAYLMGDDNCRSITSAAGLPRARFSIH